MRISSRRDKSAIATSSAVKRIIKFIKTPFGSMAALLACVAIGALLIHGGGNNERPITAATALPAPMERHTITRDGQELKIPAPSRPAAPAPERAEPGEEAVSRPRAARQNSDTAPARPKAPAILPISLLDKNTNATASADATAPSRNYAPYGRLIPCETVITLESSQLDTPVIGLVTEDVWHEGRLIIPAGAEVHGRAATDRARERIAASGQWIIVWRDRTTDNGMELVLNGIALDRDRDDVTGEFGLRDGAAGLAGQIIKTDDFQEIKLFASTFLAGMASGLQDMQDNGSLAGAGIAIPQATAKNASLAGTAGVLNAYAAQIQKRIEEDGFYVRVPAGKQFYIYVTQTLDKAKAARGNGSAKLWQKTDAENPTDAPAQERR
ncbi:hypothetical protein AW736_26545 [Termitidicoccus mucosus]|uniref:TrbI/VirB10 family protein n=1 Tax=Termitidicoccus mucosus TaxID=1184151 RepID=A0A178IPR5_9BACT|nr:hypothetical protein AW736_26545 [Opitutaceae bacterium TSB47]